MALGQSEIEVAKRGGRAFMAWSGQPSLTTTNNRFQLLFANPSGSNKNTFFFYLVSDVSLGSAFQSSNVQIANVRLNPTTSFSGGTSGVMTNMQVGSSAPSTTLTTQASSTALAGGTQIAGLGFNTGARTTFPEFTLMLPPGSSIGLELVVPVSLSLFFGLSGISSVIAQMIAYFYEESLV